MKSAGCMCCGATCRGVWCPRCVAHIGPATLPPWERTHAARLGTPCPFTGAGTIRTLGLGAGVQSTTIALMSLYGELEPFDHMIFADTGWEPPAVYEHLEKLKAEAARFGKSVTTVRAGNIRDDHVAPVGEHLFIRNAKKRPDYQGKQRSFIPFYVVGGDGKKGKTFRTCTKTYKIEPVEQHIKAVVLGIAPRQRWPTTPTVQHTLGISWDETQRMRDSDKPAIVFDYPLIDRRMTRDDCHEWLAAHGWTAPRSACIGCPFHRNDEWRRLRDEDPSSWADAVAFDHAFRQRVLDGITALDGTPYLHDSRVPLDQADIDEKPDHAPSLFDTMFGESCDGFCGT